MMPTVRRQTTYCLCSRKILQIKDWGSNRTCPPPSSVPLFFWRLKCLCSSPTLLAADRRFKYYFLVKARVMFMSLYSPTLLEKNEEKSFACNSYYWTVLDTLYSGQTSLTNVTFSICMTTRCLKITEKVLFNIACEWSYDWVDKS